MMLEHHARAHMCQGMDAGFCLVMVSENVADEVWCIFNGIFCSFFGEYIKYL